MSLAIWIILAVVSALFGAYCSALVLSLQKLSATKLAATNMPRQGIHWLIEHRDSVGLAASLWRRVSSIVFVLSVLQSFHLWYDTIDPLIDSSAKLSILLATAACVFFWHWFVDTGLAWGISEHIATPLIRGSLPLLPALHVASLPLILPLHWLSEGVRRVVGAGEAQDPLERELLDVAEKRRIEGDISSTEHEMIEAIVEFRDATAGQIMTPRIDIESIEMTNDLEVLRTAVVAGRHSRFPVYVEDIDHIQGVLYAKDLLPWLGRPGAGFELKDMLRQTLFVPESRAISDLLHDFKKKNVHIAVVLDEYGGTAGLVTIEDVIEQIFGDIRDEYEPADHAEDPILRLQDGDFEVDARVRVVELNSELGSSIPEDADFDTVGGWVFSTIGRIPLQGERFRMDRFEVTILRAERTHINRIRLRVLPPEGNGAGAVESLIGSEVSSRT